LKHKTVFQRAQLKQNIHRAADTRAESNYRVYGKRWKRYFVGK